MTAAPELAPPSAGPGLDAMLSEAASGSISQFLPGRAGLTMAAKLTTRPVTVARR